MPFIGLIITIIATVLIAPSSSEWSFQLSGGSRVISLIMLGFFWIIDLIFIFRWFARKNSNENRKIEEEKQEFILFYNAYNKMTVQNISKIAKSINNKLKTKELTKNDLIIWIWKNK